MSDDLLSIGELAARTGVAITALRYYDELGLVSPQRRSSGQRRYAESAVRDVGAVLLLRDIGFSLAEISELIADEPRTRRWSDLVARKLEELAQQERRLVAARTALEHARDCPAKDPVRCPHFWTVIDTRLDGASLGDSHSALH